MNPYFDAYQQILRLYIPMYHMLLVAVDQRSSQGCNILKSQDNIILKSFSDNNGSIHQSFYNVEAKQKYEVAHTVADRLSLKTLYLCNSL